MAAVPRFAADDAEAAVRAARWRTVDPFPKVPPALLNSRDIADYVAATAMLFPFYDQDDKLKPASYEVDLLGRCVSWDESGQPTDQVIKRGDPLVLKANSITFVTVEPYFRLPPYIALRFNLRITHVYRGLLLGTGPLIDPGFDGPLSIPLHNLTTNDYTVYGGDGLIWMEFTKLSPEPAVTGARRGPARQGRIVPLPPSKRGGLDVMYYLRKAEPQLPLRPIRSGIPLATEQASKAAREARDTTAEADKAIAALQKRVRTGTIIAVITTLFAIGGLVGTFWSLLAETDARLDNLTPSKTTDQMKQQISQLQDEVKRLKASPKPSVTTSP